MSSFTTPSEPDDDHRYAWPATDVGDDRLRWARRGIFAVLLIAAAVFVVYAFDHAPDSQVAPILDPAVVKQVPSPGSHVLHQSQVGAILRPGYDGRLTIDGVAIPENQMDGAIPTSSPAYDPRLGIRPNTRNEVLFTPRQGKILDGYDTGDVTLSVRYWKIADGESRARNITWTISVN